MTSSILMAVRCAISLDVIVSALEYSSPLPYPSLTVTTAGIGDGDGATNIDELLYWLFIC